MNLTHRDFLLALADYDLKRYGPSPRRGQHSLERKNSGRTWLLVGEILPMTAWLSEEPIPIVALWNLKSNQILIKKNSNFVALDSYLFLGPGWTESLEGTQLKARLFFLPGGRLT